MLPLLPKVQQMQDAVAVRHQPVGNERAVAVGRVAFGAHDAHATLSPGERGSRTLEFLGLHVIGVRRPHAAQCFSFPDVRDARLFDRSSKVPFGELRMTARSRVGTHICQRANTGFLEDCDELLSAASAVTDGEDQAALAAFFSSVLASFFFLSLSSSAFAAGASSGRSISVTSAIGALSPLRKPTLRMRR